MAEMKDVKKRELPNQYYVEARLADKVAKMVTDTLVRTMRDPDPDTITREAYSYASHLIRHRRAFRAALREHYRGD